MAIDMKRGQIGFILQGIIGLLNEQVEAPARLALIASLEGRSVTVLRAASLLDALKPRVCIGDDGHRAVVVAPPG